MMKCKTILMDQGVVRLSVVLLALAGLYYHVLVQLAKTWAVNDNFSHGYFIPLVSLCMIFSLREKLQKEVVRPSNWGLMILLGGLTLLVLATVASLNFMQQTSLLIVLWGLVLYFFGRRCAALLFVPIAYLVFMIPIPAILWNKIAFPMQLYSTAMTEKIIQLFGVTVYREGNVLYLVETTLEVVDACSGLRSLTTMFALSAALAWFAHYSTWRKWLVFFAAVPIAIFVNMVRLTATALLASRYGEKVAQGFLHEFSGMLVFILGLVLLWATNMLMSKGAGSGK
ncbi:MAG: exosortase/archaeosortase family protein [Proteobacteria bacterium]|nr:exosortase/archaeosortase family protein [Pseudomonadota bacterium]MBU1640704.1 exosortase/archaeosortase family protein [Pseudomonadota bacterium]